MDSQDFQKDNERINDPPIQDDTAEKLLLIRDLKEFTAVVNLASWKGPFTRIPALPFGTLYSQKCRSYSPPRSRSGTAHPSSSWCQEVREAAASRAWRGRPADSHMCCQEMIEMSVVSHSSLFFSFFCFFPQRETTMFPPEQARHDRIHFEWNESEFGIPEVSRQQLLHLNVLLTLLFLQLNTLHLLNQPVDVQARNKPKNNPTQKV